MEELDIPNSLATDDLFDLFKRQLKKDFEGAGADGSFTDTLPVQLEALQHCILRVLDPIVRSGAGLLESLLYRIDISETQLKSYSLSHAHLRFEEVLTELIIKRVLQKVILKKRFS